MPGLRSSISTERRHVERFGPALVVVPIVSTVMIVVLAGVFLWARSTMRRARQTARSSVDGTAGLPPLTAIPGDSERGRWLPRDPALRDWTWSGGRAQPPDVLGGPDAVYDTVIARELRGSYRGREASAQVRVLQRVPFVPRSAPQTHWSKVVGLRSTATLPRFFALTEQPGLLASTAALPVAVGLDKVVGGLGPRTVLWADRRSSPLIAAAVQPLLAGGTPAPYLLASDGSTLFVCESRGEDESAVLARLRLGDEVLRALEQALPPSDRP